MVLDDGVGDISRSRTIAAEPQAIWDVLADFGALSSWADGIDHSYILNDGPHSAPLGTARRLQVGSNTLVERITVFDPPTTLAYDIEGLPARLRKVANRWTLRPVGDQTVVALIAAANRDPRQFVDPDRLQLDRSPNPHISFGRGPHSCMGLQIARLQARAVLRLLHEAGGAIRFAAVPEIRPNATLRGYRHILIEC